MDAYYARSASPYLGNDKIMAEILWHDWVEKTFKIARRQRKPVLLDLYASWCHWCAVMEETTYREPEVIKLIEDNFIAVKVDADRRPDINSRYNLGGWPTTAFLKPDGSLITGGTFIEAQMMRRLLWEIHTAFDAGDEALAKSFPEIGVYQLEPPPSGTPGLLSDEIRRYFGDLIARNFDATHGGFGSPPKFPMPQALSLTLTLAAAKDPVYLDILNLTLSRMAESELFDPQNGGFFRYSVNADWSSPHREKLLIDQAELALIYMDAFRLTGNGSYADVANQVLDFIETVLLKPHGRFCGSQKANERYYEAPPSERLAMTLPPVDETVFSHSSARACSAFIKADTILKRPGATDISLRALNFLYNRMRGRGGLFWHYFDGSTTGGRGFLADQISVLTALIDAYEAAANPVFISEAVTLAQAVQDRLRDRNTGAFFDRLPGREIIGALSQPYHPIDLNAKAAIAYIRLAYITGKREFEQAARASLGAFTAGYRDYGILASEYGQAVGWLLAPVLEIFLTGARETVIASDLWQTARSAYHPHKVLIVNGRRPIKTPPALPEAAAEPAALVCLGPKCLEPAFNPEQLSERLAEAA